MEKEITISKQQIYKGKVISLEVNDVKCSNGQISKREIVKHPGGVCILAILNNKVILEKQYRAPFDDFIIELPAGKLNIGEDPKDAAKREFEEEVGYKVGSIKKVGEIYPSVGYTNEVIHLFIATNLIKTKTKLDDDEDIELLLVDKDQISKLLSENVIKDAKTFVLLSKYLLAVR